MSHTREQQVIAAPLTRGAKTAIAALTLSKLWLVSGQKFTADSFALNDDFMFIKNASMLLARMWLGPYDNKTLAKGPMYSLWIASTHVAGIPLWFANHVLYLGACLALIYALRPLIARQSVLVAVFALMFFNPISWAITRAIREQIYFSLALLIIACAIGLYIRRVGTLRQLSLWSIGLGGSLSAFWLTREEAIWILPFVALMTGSAILAILWERAQLPRRERLIRIALCLLPFPFLIGSITAISAENYATYGVWATSDFSGGNFPVAVGALMRVEPDHWQQYNLVPRESREKIYQVSPAFRELEPYLEGILGQSWALSSCGVRSDWCSDIYGGWFLWAMRDAVREAGHYQSGAETQQYFARIAQEVNAACDQGKLRCGPQNNSLTPRWHQEYLPFVVDAMRRSFWLAAQFKGITPLTAPSRGTASGIALVQHVTGNTLAPTQEQPLLEINGWAASPSVRTTELILQADGTPAEMTFQLVPSLDVAAYLNTNGKHFENADNARFIITTTCNSGCQLVVQGGGKELGRLPLQQAGQGLANENVHMQISSLTLVQQSTASGVLNRGKFAVLDRIHNLYQLGTPILAIPALGFLILGAIGFLRRRTSPILLFSTALLGALVSNLLVVAYVDSTSFLAVVPHYLCCAYVILPLAIMFALWDGYTLCRAGLGLGAARFQTTPIIATPAPLDHLVVTDGECEEAAAQGEKAESVTHLSR